MDEITISPYKSGYLSVGPDLIGVGTSHEIYYEACGNPNGKPILYVHGGPGAGFSESAKKWFDSKLWNIILFDQRGSGKSKPFACLEHNTTDDLVSDINTLQDFLGIEKVTLFGGSWGSTLSLVFAIKNPQRVNGMILRGIYLPSKEDNTYMFGGGMNLFRPEAWERFTSHVPDSQKNNPAPYYLDKMIHGTPSEKEHFSYEWAYYEGSLIKLRIGPKDMEKEMHDFNYKAMSPLEAHYVLNGCFIPEGYILDNAQVLSNIPVVLVNGKYDLICPPYMAYALHKKIPNSKLYYTVAGHASSDSRKVLLREVRKMYKTLENR